MMSVLLSFLLTLRTWARSRAALQLEVLALRPAAGPAAQPTAAGATYDGRPLALGAALANLGWMAERHS